MREFPLLWNGREIGKLTAEEEPLYTRFSARCLLPEEGIWRAWIMGEQGELLLGVLQPCGGEGAICRRLSRRMTAPLGRPVRGELRLAGEELREWEALTAPKKLFHTPWLCRQLQGRPGLLWKEEGAVRVVAFPYDPKKPFPLVPLFCFAQMTGIGGKPYVLYRFRPDERPCFEKNEKK